ncbi:hypothetical protein [Bradyrhizobium zhanjiangense]|uniref:hypothetical protein n=1 Tax=Bradyrhizobium zhanjiangense TaxID=1325107 RepID=UPI0010091690|nr:hypothetical protein [Bradyrhizobium zhanjiangense]
MPANPFIDLRCFPDRKHQRLFASRGWRYVILALFWVLTIAAFGMAVRNLQNDLTRRTGRHLGVWVVRVSSLHVVSGHVMEAAAAGVRWSAILDRAGIN